MAFYKSPAAKKFKPKKTSQVAAERDEKLNPPTGRSNPRLPVGPDPGAWGGNTSARSDFEAAQQAAVNLTDPGITPIFGAAAVNPVTGATGAGAPGGFGQGQTQTAFGNRIAPGMYTEAWNDPDALIREWFRHRGMGTTGGLYPTMLDQADNLGILWLLTQNQETPQDYANFIDWTGGHLGQQLTPGGESYSSDDIFNAIFGTMGNESSPLRNYLANPGLNAADQVGNVGSTMNKALETSMPDIVRAAVLARVRELGDDFQSMRLRGQDPEGLYGGPYSGATPFTEYLTGRDPFFGGFGG